MRTPAKRAGEARYKAKNQKTVAVNFLPPSMELYDYLVSAAKAQEMTNAQYLRKLLAADMAGKEGNRNGN